MTEAQQDRFVGKVAVVTGGGSGLGAEVCVGLARRGCHIAVLFSRDADAAGGTVARCRELGVDAVAIKTDVSQDAECRDAVQTIVSRWGRLDILVNGAGRTKMTVMSDLEATSADDFLDIYRVNTIGAFQMIRAAAPTMKAHGFGAIVNISSIAGLRGTGSSLAYAASKGALNTLTIALARELAPEIRVNAVCPGFMDTGWFSGPLGPDTAKKLAAEQAAAMPLQQAGTAELVAPAVIFLATEGADHTTGTLQVCDGGDLLRPWALASGDGTGLSI